MVETAVFSIFQRPLAGPAHSPAPMEVLPVQPLGCDRADDHAVADEPDEAIAAQAEAASETLPGSAMSDTAHEPHLAPGWLESEQHHLPEPAVDAGEDSDQEVVSHGLHGGDDHDSPGEWDQEPEAPAEALPGEPIAETAHEPDPEHPWLAPEQHQPIRPILAVSEAADEDAVSAMPLPEVLALEEYTLEEVPQDGEASLLDPMIGSGITHDPGEDLQSAEAEFQLDPSPMVMGGVSLSSDLLGLANPDVIALRARVQKDEPVMLSAASSGLYRPHDFRPAPWSGFAYDQISAVQSGVLAGTRILTNRGEIEVETLLPGDAALALRGPALLPIAWIGRSYLTVPAVAFEAGALGPNLPRRQLCVGPDQLVYSEPEPTAARDLVNDHTICFITIEAEMFHVDLGRPEVLFAEGVPLGASSRAALQAAE